jgi:hypothetical protein
VIELDAAIDGLKKVDGAGGRSRNRSGPGRLGERGQTRLGVRAGVVARLFARRVGKKVGPPNAGEPALAGGDFAPVRAPSNLALSRAPGNLKVELRN